MNLYFLRHAPTLANITGEIVKDYEGYKHQGLVTYLFEIIK